jgi:multidrug efflux pump
MLTGTLITTAGFIPVGFAASTAGEYVRTLFYVVGIALVVSWFVAVYFTPWLGYMILKQRHHAGEHHDASTRASTAGFGHRRLGRAPSHHRAAMTLVTFVTSLWAFQFIPQNFFPQSSRPEILVDLWLPEGTSIKEVETQAKALEAKMMDDKDKKFIATYIGEGAPRFFLPLDQQLRNPNFAQLLVMANDEPARERLIVKLRDHSGGGLPRHPRQGRPPVPRPADRLAGADARHGAGSPGGPQDRRPGEGEVPGQSAARRHS